MRIRRLGVTLVLSGLTLLGTATPASAHAELIASNPAEGASLATAPTQIELTFNQVVGLGDNPVEITGPGNATWTVQPPSVSGAVVTAPVVATGPAGAYTLAYRVVSQDGDQVNGSVRFTMTTAATTTTTTTTATTTTAPPSPTQNTADPAPDDPDGVPAWVWIAGAVVLVAGLVIGIRLRRRS